MNLYAAIGKPELEIRAAWIAALISGGITLLAGVIGALGGWYLVDVALCLGLAFGIYKRSRVCAVLALCNFFLNRIYVIFTFHKTPSVEVYFLGAAYILGVHGTIEHHKSLKIRRLADEQRLRYQPPTDGLHPTAGGERNAG